MGYPPDCDVQRQKRLAEAADAFLGRGRLERSDWLRPLKWWGVIAAAVLVWQLL